MTNGDKGCSNMNLCGNMSNAELAELRKQEQYRSAEILGIPLQNIQFLGYEDVLLKTYDRAELLRQIVLAVRTVKPHVVMTWDSAPHFNMLPSEWSDLGYHPDHQFSGDLTIDAIWQAKLSRLWPDLGDSWTVEEVYQWAFNPDTVPSHYVDITGEPSAAKTEAFLQMKSQYTDPATIVAMFLILGQRMGETCQLPDCVMSEGYQYILW